MKIPKFRSIIKYYNNLLKFFFFFFVQKIPFPLHLWLKRDCCKCCFKQKSSHFWHFFLPISRGGAVFFIGKGFFFFFKYHYIQV